MAVVRDDDLRLLRHHELSDLLVFWDPRHLHCFVGEDVHLSFYPLVETNGVCVVVGEGFLLVVVVSVVVLGSYGLHRIWGLSN